MEWIETAGETLEEAVESALDKLGVSNKDLEYEVLEEGSTKLFRKKDFQVRARIKPVNNKKRKTKAKAKPKLKAESQSKPKVKLESNVPVEEQLKFAHDFCRHVVGYFDPKGVVNSKIEDDCIQIEIEGDNIGALIGEKGLTALSLEELVRVKLKKECEGIHNKTYVDVGGYKEKRKVALAAFSLQVIEKVKTSEEEHIFEPMNPAERKVVHDVVAETEGVGSTSKGYEPRRRVVVYLENEG
jgi:spoIIIJ-associated protein